MGALLSVFPDQAEALFGPMGYTNPAFILVVYTPGHRRPRAGRPALRDPRPGTVLPSADLVADVRDLVAAPAGRACPRCSTPAPPSRAHWATPSRSPPGTRCFPALIPALLIGPIEELGWRGIALPLLQRRLAPLWASLILGVVMAVWHTPAFFLSGTKQSGWAIGPFFVGVVAISVILAAMFNASRGSLLVAVLFHAQMNGPAWPDAQPWDMYLFVVVAVVVVLVNRKAMLSRDGGATAILTDGRRAGDPTPVRQRVARRRDLGPTLGP